MRKKGFLSDLSRNRFMTFFLMLCLLIGYNNELYPQQAKKIRVTGTVLDENNEPLIGATIQMVGASAGMITDLDGKFVFPSIPSTAVLKISYVGYKEKLVKVNGQRNLKISLESDQEVLDEVVVIGYGSMKKRDITGAITSVTSKSIEERQPTDVFEALQGEAPGVMIISNSGAPGDASTVRVRGTSTFDAGVNPLFVVDGIQMDDISSINPNDIQSMEILKDAASASIYGSRSANGVILITTKQGEAGKVKVNGRYLFGVSKIANKIEQANSYERAIFESFYNKYQLIYNPFAEDPNNVNYRGNIDYQDAITRSALKSQVDLSISSASESTKYYTAVSYLDETGIILNTYNKRLTFRASVDHKANEKLSFVTNVNYSYSDRNKTNESMVLGLALKRPPHFTMFNPDGSYIYDNAGLKNPVAEANLRIDRPIVHTITVNETAKYKFNKYLTAQANVNGTLNVSQNERFISGLLDEKNGISSGGDYTNINRNYTAEFILNYNRRFNPGHNVALMGGTSVQDWYNKNMVLAGTEYVTEDIHTINSIQKLDLTKTTTGISSNSMASFFGRASYNFQGRYLANFNLRADGSSRFDKNRWGYFPSVSLGWRFSDEKFMKFSKSFLQDAKLRLSWGITGNERIGNYDSQVIYGVGSYYYNDVSGVRPLSSIGNPDIKWEQTSQYNVGLDLTLLQGKIKVTFDYYNKLTDGLLYNMNMPIESGYNTMRVNMGSVRNSGYELTVAADVISTKYFKWRSVFNYSFNKNKIESLGTEDYVASGGWLVAVGQPIGQFYGYKASGVYPYDESNAYTPDFKTQLIPIFERDNNNNVIINDYGKPNLIGYNTPDGQPYDGEVAKRKYASTIFKGGDIIWEDVNNDGQINEKDRQNLGNGMPTNYLSWNNTFTWRGIALTINFYGSFGNKIYNAYNQSLYSLPHANMTPRPYEIFNLWTRPGQVTDVPIADKSSASHNQNLTLNSIYLENGSFIRLKNVRLAYTFTKKKFNRLPVSELGIWGYANNLFTWTDYSGFDPEISSTNVLTPGNDTGRFPRKREFGVGLNVMF